MQDIPRPLRAEQFWASLAAKLAVNDTVIAMKYRGNSSGGASGSTRSTRGIVVGSPCEADAAVAAAALLAAAAR